MKPFLQALLVLSLILSVTCDSPPQKFAIDYLFDDETPKETDPSTEVDDAFPEDSLILNSNGAFDLASYDEGLEEPKFFESPSYDDPLLWPDFNEEERLAKDSPSSQADEDLLLRQMFVDYLLTGETDNENEKDYLMDSWPYFSAEKDDYDGYQNEVNDENYFQMVDTAEYESIPIKESLDWGVNELDTDYAEDTGDFEEELPDIQMPLNDPINDVPSSSKAPKEYDDKKDQLQGSASESDDQETRATSPPKVNAILMVQQYIVYANPVDEKQESDIDSDSKSYSIDVDLHSRRRTYHPTVGLAGPLLMIAGIFVLFMTIYMGITMARRSFTKKESSEAEPKPGYERLENEVV